MITTRTRILSILAVVAMLVSMLACFIIPASAEEDRTEAWKYALLSIQDYKNVAPLTTALFKKASATEPTATWAEVKAQAIAEIKPQFEAAEPTAFWNEFSWNGDAITNRYPRYRYHEEFEACGYSANIWTIDNAADWLLMIEESKYDATNNPTPKTFEGAVFHVIKNINFNNEVMEPLCLGTLGGQDNDTSAPFQGTIEGHGNAFYNINVNAVVNPPAKKNATVGMIGKYGSSAKINNFGVDSGTISASGTISKGKSLFVSTFGDPVENIVSNRLNKVWSGATIVANSTSEGAINLAAGFAAAGQDSQNLTNGAYFFGTLSAADGAYGIWHQLKNEQLYNVLSDPKAAQGTTITAANKKYDGGLLYLYSNVYTVGDAALYEGYAGTGDDRVSTSGNVDSAAEGAWKINSNQPSTIRIKKINNSTYELLDATDDPIPVVYYTWTKDAAGNDAIRPTGTAANRIVQLKVNDKAAYINNGTAVTKAELAEILDEELEDIIAITVNGSLLTEDSFELEGDTTVAVELVVPTYLEDLAESVAKYAALDAKYLTDAAASALEAYRTAAAAAIEANDEAAAEAVLAGEAAMEEALATYSTYPAAEGKEIPAYSLHTTYDAYNKAKAWAITAPADWFAMDVAANAASDHEYFAGTTFHLTNDIDFNQDGDGEGDAAALQYTDYMWPLGSKGTRAFAGTINGHGYSFKDVYIKNIKSDQSDYITGYSNNHVGLFALIGAATIVDFGIHNGTIYATTGTGTANVSTFGAVDTDKTATFTRVWSGANLNSLGNNLHISALAAVYSGSNTSTVSTTSKIIVDGFVFYGNVNKMKAHASGFNRNAAFGVFGGANAGQADGSTFNNIISDMTNKSVDGIGTYLFGFTDDDAYKAATINNVYGLGDIAQTYRIGTTAATVADGETNLLVSNISAVEAAYAINNSGTNGTVYFKLVDGAVRPTADSSNAIVKVALTAGEKSGELYVNKNTTVAVADIAAALGVDAADILTINGAAAADVAITDDTTLTVELYVCDHTANTNTAVWDTDTKYHHIICSECGKEIEGSRVQCSGERVGSEIDMVNGTATESITCTICEHVYTANCTGTLTPNAEDCTANSKWVFTCTKHSGEYEIPDSGKAAHDFSEAEWEPAGGIGEKQSKTCACCTAKIYQIIGGAAAEGVELKADAAGNIVLTLPVALKSAKLTFTVPAGYTITNVEGAAAGEGFYTVPNTAAGATITITVDSALSAIGGVLEVAVTDAIAEDDTAVTDAIAQATIGFTAKDGDANGDDAVNLADALAVLYVVTSTKNVSTINAYNANVFLANDEDKDALILNVNDVYAIVEAWLLDVAF